ncbi:uncharacterized protein LOC128653323 isoform X1 [Bombina bombina]|uniref:uncharacterized protein LOC128653323 isoform X1 n=1 Tax=Bombina bombina TaxID=8345 RepID=UPI00235A896D|nr:uncharacterized protein LOC128653323 isoform X1 [Bombina bombina]XP_053562514.1 uncharacterized protein LOC128653323 isoform X1 [Bombina bombina]XP_053562515.1 uncharacterized protein LOC128653323 isoform X1 [Bombina bombina]
MDRRRSVVTGLNRVKLSSLDKRDAQRVLETYMKRSLSSGSQYQQKQKFGQKVNVQRSVSDCHKTPEGQYNYKSKKHKGPPIHKSNEDVRKQHEIGNEKTMPSICENAIDRNTFTDTNKALSLPAVKKQSWLKNVLSRLFKRRDNKSEEKQTFYGNATCITKDPVAFSNDGTCRQSIRKNSNRRTSIKRVFSLKKNTSEGWNSETKVVDSGPNKPKKPTSLPLTNICRPSRGSKKEKDLFYSKVSEEIEQIVKVCESKNQSLVGDPIEDEDPDTIITKLVTVLRREGDIWDKKIKEDPFLSTFFSDITYKSFKQLADVYVEKEVQNKAVDVIPEDLAFAYSIHFTAQVAGLCSNPVNRIMGFGHQYLQDKFTQFSFNKEPWDSNAIAADPCLSPD